LAIVRRFPRVPRIGRNLKPNENTSFVRPIIGIAAALRKFDC
jgi:hypothetical protein